MLSMMWGKWLGTTPKLEKRMEKGRVQMTLIHKAREAGMDSMELVNITGFETRPGQRAGYGRVRVRVRKF